VRQQKINISENEAVQKLGERKICQRTAAIFNRLAASQIPGKERHGGVKVVAETKKLIYLKTKRSRNLGSVKSVSGSPPYLIGSPLARFAAKSATEG
jgi:hypothetical protein